jgi:zinc transport system substrate-binding protein
MRSFLSLAFVLTAGVAQAEAPRVVVDIAPLHSLVAQVMEGVGAPTLLVEPTESVHHYALRPSQAAGLEAADAVFWIGHALTPWLEAPLDSLAGDALRVEMLDAPGTRVLDVRESAEEGGHDHDHSHDHGPEGIDPHAWLDPANGLVWLAQIAENLAEIDPEHAEAYRSNAAAAAQEMSGLKADLEARLSVAADAPYLSLHDAFQYFDTGFGLAYAGSISASDAEAPSAAQLSEARHLLEHEGVVCVFAEPQQSTRRIEVVTEGTDVRIGVLDSVGADVQVGPALYATVLGNLADSFAECLTGK